MSKASFVQFAAILAPAVVFGAVLAPRTPNNSDSEVQRLRRHFAAVEQELLAHDVSHLTPPQRAARARNIVRLRTYAAAGVFPKNTDFPDRRVPYFIDRFGTRCAMAYLIEESGWDGYVHRVAEKMNNAYIAEIALDPELSDPLFLWLDANGLSAAEAARIQPEYGCGWSCPPPPPEPAPIASTPYKLGAGAAIAGGLTSIALSGSLVDWGVSHRTAGWLGVGTGLVGVALGLSHVGDKGDYELLAPLGTGVGVLSLLVGLDALVTRSERPVMASDAVRDAGPAVRTGPWVTPEGRSGVMVRVSF